MFKFYRDIHNNRIICTIFKFLIILLNVTHTSLKMIKIADIIFVILTIY